MISEYFLQELRQRIVISTIIGRTVKLIRKGRHYQGLCPFHTEKTPSFIVNDEKKRYRCFGCGVGGDVIDFLCRSERCSFTQAVKELASQAGLKLPQKSLPAPIMMHEKSLLSLMECACTFFQQNLNQSILDYLSSRGISFQTIQSFRIGWAGGQNLITHLLNQGFAHKDMLQIGLIGKRENDTYYEYFRRRIMFPIFNHNGQVIAFGGRVLDESMPKYLNSPENPLFKKGNVIYASPEFFKQYIHSALVIVEGYLDAIALSSYTSVTSSLGTAITENQLTAIWKKCANPLVCFDADPAGHQAHIKLAHLALPLLKPGLSLSFVQLPRSHDPHSFIQSYGWQEMQKYLNNALNLSDFLWENLFLSNKSPEQQALAVEQWKACVATINHPDVRYYYQQFFYKKRHKRSPKNIVPVASFCLLHQKILIGTLILKPFLIEKVREELSLMSFPSSTVWLHIRDYLLSWNIEETIENFLLWRLGNDWHAQFMDIARHIPTKEENLYTYWMELFNSYQAQLYKSKELNSLKNDLFSVPHTWDRLKHLTQL
jgi:DNA primase